MKCNRWILGVLLALIVIAPAFGAGKDSGAPKAPENNGTNAAAQPPNGATPAVTVTNGNANITALLGVLVMKGVLAPSEANDIRNAVPETEVKLLLEALARKGVLSADDIAVAAAPPAQPPVAGPSAQLSPQAPLVKESKPGPTVVPGVAPLRVLPVDPPVRDGLKAAFTVGPVKMTPYGFLKASAVYDSSNPNGDDMPFPGLFLSTPTITNTGPTKDANFHLKARQARIGSNF